MFLDLPSSTRDFCLGKSKERPPRLMQRRSFLLERSPFVSQFRIALRPLGCEQREPNGGGAIVLILTAVAIGGSRVAIEIHSKRALRAVGEQSARGISKIRRRSQRTRTDTAA